MVSGCSLELGLWEGLITARGALLLVRPLGVTRGGVVSFFTLVLSSGFNLSLSSTPETKKIVEGIFFKDRVGGNSEIGLTLKSDSK